MKAGLSIGEELGQGIRGKYYAKQRRGTNLVLLDAKLAKIFPNSEVVNGADRCLEPHATNDLGY
jgi:hypothetical protein